MTLSTAEQARLEELETAAKALAVLVKGAGSKNQLNRLYVLSEESIGKLTERVEALEAIATEVLALVRKLQ